MLWSVSRHEALVERFDRIIPGAPRIEIQLHDLLAGRSEQATHVIRTRSVAVIAVLAKDQVSSVLATRNDVMEFTQAYERFLTDIGCDDMNGVCNRCRFA